MRNRTSVKLVLFTVLCVATLVTMTLLGNWSLSYKWFNLQVLPEVSPMFSLSHTQKLFGQGGQRELQENEQGQHLHFNQGPSRRYDDSLFAEAGNPVNITSREDHAMHQDHDSNNLPLTELAKELKKKLSVVPENVLLPPTNTCVTKDDVANTCEENPQKCVYRTQLPISPEARVEQLVQHPGLQISEKHQAVIRNLTNQFHGNYDLIVVMAASSNHYLELQASIRNLHQTLFKEMTNFSLVVYDLGLTLKEREVMKKHCKCQVIVFPFSEFPEHVKTLRCFGWKPVVVKAHIEQANLVAWFDATVRLINVTELVTHLKQARIMGIQQRFYKGRIPSPKLTIQQMYHYYGDEPCAHLPYIQLETGFGLYHNEPLVRQSILTPWVACGLMKECTCPEELKKVDKCPAIPNLLQATRYGQCHRGDQSSLSTIIAKLYNRAYHYVVVDTSKSHWIQRNDKLFDYFGQLEKDKAKASNTKK